MVPRATDNAERERRLDEVVTAYLKEREAGRAPGSQECLARHPDLSPELESLLAADTQVSRLTVTPRPPAEWPATIGPEATPAPGGPCQPAGLAGTLRTFGDYELLAEVGRGGMGVVYQARQVSLDRIVALKMILTGQLAND